MIIFNAMDRQSASLTASYFGPPPTGPFPRMFGCYTLQKILGRATEDNLPLSRPSGDSEALLTQMRLAESPYWWPTVVCPGIMCPKRQRGWRKLLAPTLQVELPGKRFLWHAPTPF
jgi:hypothetical protein